MEDLKDAREVTRTVEERWVAVEGPRRCQCGHLHYGRRMSRNQAPQWHICEDPACRCAALRPDPR